MTDLERIELALYRVHAKRADEFKTGKRDCLDMGTQSLLLEIIAELQDLSQPKTKETDTERQSRLLHRVVHVQKINGTLNERSSNGCTK